LSEQVQQAAFFVHSYHHEVIGDLPDLMNMQRDDLYRHYRAYYNPANAVLTLAGHFETDEMLKRICSLYEAFPAGAKPPRPNRPEPPQPGERRLTVEGPGETTYVEVAYRAPAAIQEDFYALSVLDSLLSGPSSLNMFGGGISNKTCRLYRALVDREIALSVSGGFSATIDPFLYSITMTLHPERSLEQLMQAFDEQVERLQQDLAPVEDLTRALKQARALFAYGSESISNQAFWLGFAEMFATYDWFNGYLERLSAVTPLDVQRAAQTYLRPQSRVVGVYRPSGTPALDEEPAGPGEGDDL
jgi:zinc protease